MRSRNAWLFSLGLSGLLAFGLAGCGGDVPDPGADESAATEEGGAEPTEAAPAPEAPTFRYDPASRHFRGPAGGQDEKWQVDKARSPRWDP